MIPTRKKIKSRFYYNKDLRENCMCSKYQIANATISAYMKQQPTRGSRMRCGEIEIQRINGHRSSKLGVFEMQFKNLL